MSDKKKVAIIGAGHVAREMINTLSSCEFDATEVYEIRNFHDMIEDPRPFQKESKGRRRGQRRARTRHD